MSLLQAYNSLHQFDITCFSEIYFNNSYHSHDDQLALPGYSYIIAWIIAWILYDDIYTINGMRFEPVTFYHGLYQVINEPTHILPSSASCIDLTFTNKPNMVINRGVKGNIFNSFFAK